jgi:hypothetical protein
MVVEQNTHKRMNTPILSTVIGSSSLCYDEQLLLPFQLLLLCGQRRSAARQHGAAHSVGRLCRDSGSTCRWLAYFGLSGLSRVIVQRDERVTAGDP